MRLLVVSNLLSGTAGKRSKRNQLIGRLKDEGATIDTASPASAAETRSVAAEVRRDRYDVLLVAGGDGTLHAVANGLVTTAKASRPALAILPIGRGNDFAADIGIHSLEDTLSSLAANLRRFLDLGRTDRGVFLGVAGTGFDAQVARRAQQTPLLSGSLLYSYAVFRTLVEFRHVEARVTHDGGVYEGPLTFAAVGNTRRYGGGMYITPRADLSDGLLDLCLVRDISRAGLLYMFPTVFSGRHLGHWSVDYVQTRSVEIETLEPAEVFADGEFMQETPARIDVLPQELEVLVRPGSSRR